MNVALGSIRACLDGRVPAGIATCAPDGTPNVAYLSQVHYVDEGHVALSYQFFNKTRRNVLAHPRASVQVVDPDTVAYYRLELEYLRTETEGPLFENMKARLAGIASHTGMSKVFRLQGADVYRVHDIERVVGDQLPRPAPGRSPLAALRACARRVTVCPDLAQLFDQTLLGLAEHFGIDHALLLLLNEQGDRLYTVASRGYPESGVGSEIALGEGIIGVAARERTVIRIGHMAQEYLYSLAVRQSFMEGGHVPDLETEIPLPGLRESRSQVAVPIVVGQRLYGVLYAESPQDSFFGWEDEEALLTLADQLALAIPLLAQGADTRVEAAPAVTSSAADLATVRHYPADHSVFVGHDYLIKGVAGAIFWKLLRDFTDAGRTEFTNRELRLDPALGLPDIGDNLEARLILLQRRLAERCPFIRIEKTGRGRFRLHVGRALQLSDVPGR